MTEDLMTAKEVVALFNGLLPYKTLMKMVHSRKIKACKVGGKYVFSKTLVIQWATKNIGTTS